jgi:hypothetical protein
MFIKDGKSLLGNWGLIISLAVLVILLFFSYNKCMISLDKEGFAASISPDASSLDSVKLTATSTSTTTTTKDVSFPPPQNPRVNITGSTITLNFTVAPVAGTPTPIQFMVVLVQYDSTLTPTGNNKFYISNESIINPGVSSTPATGTTIRTPTNNSLCQLVNGSPACQYIFKNLDMVDTSGNPYYYKVGISAVYTNGNSRFVLPYNVVNSNGIFSLATSLDAQNNQFSDYIKNKQMQTQMKSANYSSTTATPDGQYELIKAQLGGYPSNLIMDPTSAKQNMLSDLVDKSMAQALLNVNVNVNT